MALSCDNFFSTCEASLSAVIGPSTKEVMVYGYSDACYRSMAEALVPRMDLVLDHCLNVVRSSDITKRPLLSFFLTVSENSYNLRRNCKKTVTYLALENYLRVKNHQPIIPLLFCVGSNLQGGCNPPTVQSLTTKDQPENRFYTHAELRRVYKLCTEFAISEDPSLQELSLVAQKMLQMVTVDVNESHKCVLHSVRPTWEEEGWAEAWKERKATKSTTTALIGGWRDILREHVQWADRVVATNEKIKGKNTESVRDEVRGMVQSYLAQIGGERGLPFARFVSLLKNHPEDAMRLRTIFELPSTVEISELLVTQTFADMYASSCV